VSLSYWFAHASSHGSLLFFCDAPATTDTYTLSLHDALPISSWRRRPSRLTVSALPPRTCTKRSWSGEVEMRLSQTCPSAPSTPWLRRCGSRTQKDVRLVVGT